MSDLEPVETYALQTAALLGLPIAPEHLPGVVDNLRRLFEQAALVFEFPLDDDIEAGPVFHP